MRSYLSGIGEIMGTPFYMAPEQAEDPRGVDTRADVYSFGAMFYHALTGQHPFDGPTAFSILYQHKTEPLVSPSARNPEISRRISDLLERCLAKSPSARFQSFAEILRQLEPTPTVPLPWDASDDAELAEYLARYATSRAAYLSERRAWNEELDVYTFPRGQTLHIVRGDIVSQCVDVLVSSDTYNLWMSGGVAEAIRCSAGQEVAEQAQRLAPVRPGRVAVTSA